MIALLKEGLFGKLEKIREAHAPEWMEIVVQRMCAPYRCFQGLQGLRAVIELKGESVKVSVLHMRLMVEDHEYL